MKWQQLEPDQRYQIVEMALAGKAKTADLCKTFGMSRQTLYRAMDLARKGAMEALTPKAAGRPAKPESQVREEELEKRLSLQGKELEHWKTKFEVATALLELERQYDRGETGEGEKKTRRKRRKRK